MKIKVIAGIMLTLLLMGMLTLAFNIQPVKSEPATGEASIIMGTTDKITVLDPAKCYDFYTWEVFNNIGEGLLKYTPGTSELEFGIAENYTVSPDGLNYTFKLREGMNFTDGEPLDAAAVKWSIDRVMSLNLAPSWLVSTFVDSVEVVNTLTVKFILQRAVSYFPALVATVPYFPVSSKSYPVDATAEPLVGHYGPYKIKSWTRDVELVLEANPDYYDPDIPKTKEFVVKFFADAASMRLALEAGEIDIAWKTLRPLDVLDLKENPDFNVVETPGGYIRYLVLRCNMTPFDDVRLRRAVAASINRTRICTDAYMGTVEPLYSMVPMGMWSHIDAFKDEYGVRNLTLARELLTAAGYNETNKFAFDLWYTPTHYGDQEADVAAIIKSSLEETGMMNVTLKSAEWATYAAEYIAAGVMPIFLLGWYPDYIDPDNYLTPFLHSEWSPDLGVFYNSSTMDTILEDAMVELNITKRTELYEDAQRLLAEDAPLIPFSQGMLYAVTRPNIEGIYLSPTMLLPYYTIYGGRRAPVTSGWLKFPVTFDGKITTAKEWSDTTPVDVTLYEWHAGPGNVSARVWIKNDDAWLYMLYKVEWSAGDTDPFDGGYIEYFWDWIGEPPPVWNHSDLSFIEFDNVTLDLYGWDETTWYDDTEASPPGENNVEGAATHDGTYYWFEFRKELNSGDGYDWAFTPGQTIEAHLLVGVWDDSTRIPYEEYILLHLSAPPLSTAVYFNLNPNPVGVGETVTLKGILVDEFSQPLSNETVKLYARPLAGSWRYITSLTTNGYGIFTWQAEIPVEGTFIFVVYYPGSETYESCYNFAVLIVQ